MKVLVTGSSGFIGQHIVRCLKRFDVEPIECDRVIGREITRLSYEDLIGIKSVIHAAAHADISKNWGDFGKASRNYIFEDNIVATRHLLECCDDVRRLRPFDVSNFVFLSTCAVYGSTFGRYADEESPIQSTSPYTASKIAGEALVEAYARGSGMNYKIFRLASCVGYGYRHGHIADFVHKARAGGKIQSLDVGHPKSFVHVEDVAEHIAEASIPVPIDAESNVVNLASELWSVRDTAREMGVDFHPGVAPAGWIGDPIGLTVRSIYEEYRCVRKVKHGVRDALKSLGWKGPHD